MAILAWLQPDWRPGAASEHLRRCSTVKSTRLQLAENILDTFRTMFNTPSYLLTMVCSYFSDKKLIYVTAGVSCTNKITTGATQGSILDPDLRNVSYDGYANTWRGGFPAKAQPGD